MRRLTSLVAVAALLAMLLPATAAAAVRTTEHITALTCGVQSDLGTLFLFTEFNDRFGTYAEAVYWEDGLDPEVDPPTLVGFEGVLSPTPNGLGGSVTMFDDATGEPAGDLTFELSFTPIGDPEASRNADAKAITGTAPPAWSRGTRSRAPPRLTRSATSIWRTAVTVSRRRSPRRQCACVVRQPVR